MSNALAKCQSCGRVEVDYPAVVIYIELGLRGHHSYSAGFRCPKCDRLCHQTADQEFAHRADSMGSQALFGKTHPLEVTEREAKKPTDPFTWDEYLDGYSARLKRDDAAWVEAIGALT